MTQFTKVTLPDIGDFQEVPVVEILVSPGDEVEQETPLLVLETDKASMEVPAPQAGIVREIHVKAGDRISQGSLIITLEVREVGAQAASTTPSGDTGRTDNQPAAPDTEASVERVASVPVTARGEIHAEVAVLGAGPGGYTAAFRAADLGKQVVLIERYPVLGGVCLNVGCIPSKALLHAAKTLTEAKEASLYGIRFGQPEIDVGKLRSWKESVVGKLTKGLSTLARQRKVTVIHGTGKFVNPHLIEVETSDGIKTISFDHCVIAAGSSAAHIPGLPADERIIDSTGALALAEIPERMLILGGGIIGLEMATVYHALGTRISIVERMAQLIPGADTDLIKPLYKKLKTECEAIYLNTSVSRVEADKEGLQVFFEGEQAPEPQRYDRVLVAVGRRPNGKLIDAGAAGINVDERGFIPVDKQMRTSVPHIFAIGDIAGDPMLAHKASHEGKIAAEVIAGHKVTFDARTIPSVAYTDPEVAWMGLTETEAEKQGIAYEKAVFPWAASGRAITMTRDEGMTKLLFDKVSKRILGAGMVGPHAGELIAETVLALEMGADMQDIGLTIHPHPTLSETVLFAAELAEGTITDLYVPKK
ncbi:MAG TPA: dihydrolipoyl dehydrogenase [Nitrosomonas europaea]|uniref:dihydrolipoyl dehydrogenase n=1 Tax=Nitrosomonas europaea TaxID=915 RepID=UPI002491ECFC|nr:dihydrolipoyl dehydrogenase [Nitrosomonas europaea]HRN81813.1 dihydrolipoyl dehydrogenase [Nitrosomonas europaea]HRO57067.1 dihydrolipoyl dehydrogenase [Nitrosomonas europaea]HRQ08598.1 dihydrolipoyl dehydrogenase [Nitrosomonas europaea]HUM74620.1 dihydrolipoyl dehydrogenase [Nitrosomonas europaea]